jgi:hypothetical protein
VRISGGDNSSELVARRWTRQGRDRLYVSTQSGERVGWVDMSTGQAMLQKSVLATEFAQAVKKWRGENGETARIIPALSINMFPHDRSDLEKAAPRLPPAETISDERRRLAAQARHNAIGRPESRTRRVVRFLVGEPAVN